MSDWLSLLARFAHGDTDCVVDIFDVTDQPKPASIATR